MLKLPGKILVAMALLPVVFFSGSALSAAPEVRFSLENIKPSYRAGEPILLSWRLSNHSRRSLRILEAMETPDHLEFDPIGLTISRITAAGVMPGAVINLMGKRTAVRRVMGDLTPGASFTQSFDLSMFAAFYGVRLERGKYRLSAKYDLGHAGILADDERAQALTESVVAPAVVITIE